MPIIKFPSLRQEMKKRQQDSLIKTNLKSLNSHELSSANQTSFNPLTDENPFLVIHLSNDTKFIQKRAKRKNIPFRSVSKDDVCPGFVIQFPFGESSFGSMEPIFLSKRLIPLNNRTNATSRGSGVISTPKVESITQVSPTIKQASDLSSSDDGKLENTPRTRATRSSARKTSRT